MTESLMKNCMLGGIPPAHMAHEIPCRCEIVRLYDDQKYHLNVSLSIN